VLISTHSAPCSRLRSLDAAGSPLGVPSSALQRGGQALARRRGPQPTAQLGRSSLGVGGDCGACGRRPRSLHAAGSPIGIPSSPLQRGRQAPARCVRSHRHAQLGRSTLSVGGDCGACGRRPRSLRAAGSPIEVPRSALQRGGQVLARRRGPQPTAQLGRSLLGVEDDCGACGRRPRSLHAAGSPIGVPSSALQRGGQAPARCVRSQRHAQFGRWTLGVGGDCGAPSPFPFSWHAAGAPIRAPCSALHRGGRALAR